MALRLSSLNPKNMVHAISRQVTIAHHTYENITLSTFLNNLIPKTKPLKIKPIKKSALFPKLKAKKYFDSSLLTVEAIIQAINHLFNEKCIMPVVADNGDCLFASLDIHTPILLASGYYATMGFAVPAGMGVQIGSGKRPLILVGDGAFQMTGMEISHCPRLGLNPIVIVFNNRRWEMLRAIQPQGKYFDLTLWDFAKLAELWGGRGITVHSKKEMLQAMFKASREKKFVIIDAILPLGETSKVLQNYLKRIRG
jgi:indolepyruvate decarboxylase